MNPGNEPQGPNNARPNQIGVQQNNLEQEELFNLATFNRYQVETPVGVAMFLSCRGSDGVPEYIETRIVEQGPLTRGGCTLDGFIGIMMIESFHIAYNFACNVLFEKQPENRFFITFKLRLQFLLHEAVARDGSSAGCALVTSLLSRAMNRPVRRNLAMSGAIDITGRVLRIGGVREKTIAAKSCQVKMIIFPYANHRDFQRLEDDVKKGSMLALSLITTRFSG